MGCVPRRNGHLQNWLSDWGNLAPVFYNSWSHFSSGWSSLNRAFPLMLRHADTAHHRAELRDTVVHSSGTSTGCKALCDALWGLQVDMSMIASSPSPEACSGTQGISKECMSGRQLSESIWLHCSTWRLSQALNQGSLWRCFVDVDKIYNRLICK